MLGGIPISPTNKLDPLPLKPEESVAFKAGVGVIMALSITIVVGGSFILYRYLTKPEPAPVVEKPASPATAETPAPADQPAPSPTPHERNSANPVVTDQPTSQAAQLINKAAAVIETSNQARQIPDLTTPTPADPTPPPIPQPPPPPPTPVEPGLAFKAYVANMRVSGVFPERGTAMVNNRVYKIGDTIDQKLRITFDSVDGEKKTLIFKDSTGALLTRRY